MKRLSITVVFLVALLAPAMAWASTGGSGGGAGWLAVAGMALGAAAAGAVAVRAGDDDEPDAEEPSDKDKPEGLKPSGVCATCGMGNPMDNKFCGQCGASMAAPPLETEDEPPPSSEKPGAAVALMAPKRISAEATVAGILGASSESVPAIKTRAIDLRHVFDTAVAVTGKSDPREIVGAMLTYPDRLARGDKAASDLKAQNVSREKNERLDLAKRLNTLALDAWPRSMIFEDKVTDGGQRTVALRPVIAKMDIGVLRGMVEAHESSRTRKPRDPFKPSEEAARNAAAAHDPRNPPAADAPAATVVAWAQTQPSFANMRKQLPSTITDETIGRQLAATMRGGVR